MIGKRMAQSGKCIGAYRRSEQRDGWMNPFAIGWVLVLRPIRALLFDRRHELLFVRYVMSLIH